MVRPKASEVNKAIAQIFADTVTLECNANDQQTWVEKTKASVDCRGGKSIFRALLQCLPNIVREVKDQAMTNRKGVTEVELNKHLALSGYISMRHRLWNSDLKVQWQRIWCDRRWVHLTNCGDLAHVQKQLLKLQQYPEARTLTIEHIRACLDEMFDSSSIHETYDSLSAGRQERSCSEHASSDDAGRQRDGSEPPSATAPPHRCPRGGHQNPAQRSNSGFELVQLAWSRPMRNCRPDSHYSASLAAAASDEQLPRLLRLAQEGGWDFPELRRLLTHGYFADTVWGILTSLPPDLRALLRAALRAAEMVGLSVPYTSGHQEQDAARRIFSEMDAKVWAALEAGESDNLGFFEAEYDAATQRRGAVRLSERYAALFHGSADCGRAALLTHYARHEVPLPAPELDFLAAVIDDLLRRAAGDVIQYLRVVRRPPAGEYGSNPTAFTAGGRRPSEAALVCVLSRARFDAGGRVTRVRPLPSTVRLPSPGRKRES